MELLKRFVAGVGIGVALVGLAMFALSVAPQSGAESAAQQPTGPVVPPLPGGVAPVFDPPAAPPVSADALLPKPKAEPLPPGLPPLPQAPNTDFRKAKSEVAVQPAKNEVAVKPPLGRSAVRFSGPEGMKVSWLVGEAFHDRDLTTPASFNFVQGEVYRLRLTGIAKYPNAKFYPTMEVCAPSERVLAYLGHNAIPVTFTDSELATAAEGRLVLKAVYLPGTPGAESATASEEVSSLRPGQTGDPVAAASSRGALLAVIRLGNVDLENPNSPPLHAPPTVQMPEHGPMPAPAIPNVK